MKSIIVICLSLLFAVTAQSQKKTFIRIYGESGKKANQGFLMALSDSSMTIAFRKKTFEIPVDEIATIKLRRSFGHTLLISSLAIGVPFAILFAAAADPNALFGWTAAQGVVGGLLGGVQWGALIAAIRKRPVFHVNMRKDNWINVEDALKKYLPEKITQLHLM